MPKKINKSTLEDAQGALRSMQREWLRRPGVTAVDVGYKISEQKITDDLAVRVHVRRKLPKEALEKHEILSVSGEPETVGDFPVDVIEAEYAPAQVAIEPMQALEAAEVDRRSRTTPLVGGLSVGNPRVTAGTLGAIVWDRTDCQVSILSNWHVLCGSSSCAAGEDIYQPGVADGGTVADKVAELKRWRLDKDADAALAGLTGTRAHSRDLLDLNPILGIGSPTLGTEVIKSGRTTSVTKGIIDGVGMTLSINYGGGVVQTFNDQIHIVPRAPWPAVNLEISSGGDSGSVWINESTSKAVGLHFAGETDPAPIAEHAVANRMERVAELLKFSFTPLFCPPSGDKYDRWRDIIRRVLCRRYPWLCSGWGGFQTPPPGPNRNSGSSAPSSGDAEYQARMMWGGDIEELIDEILKEMRRTG